MAPARLQTRLANKYMSPRRNVVKLQAGPVAAPAINRANGGEPLGI